MTEFFSNMDTSLQIYWYIAIASSIIFIIQTILSFVGADADTGTDADFDGNFDAGDAPFQLFSLRNLVNFLLGLGWGGVSLYSAIGNRFILAIVCILIGILFVSVFFFIMRTMMKLAEDNTFNIQDTVGKTVEVYTTIPANNKGKGKVFVSVKNTMHELDAITSHTENIGAGSFAKVESVNDSILVVTPLI